jgi:hypothetical protein
MEPVSRKTGNEGFPARGVGSLAKIVMQLGPSAGPLRGYVFEGW